MIKNNKVILRFLLVSFATYILWFVFYEMWLKQQGSLDHWLTSIVTKNSAWIMNILGYDLKVKEVFGKFFISSSFKNILGIANPCNGLVLYPLFAGFILASPGKATLKLTAIFAGSVIIYVVNLLRVIALCIVKMHAPQYLEFSHKYTFVIFVYGVIFFLWMIWINKVTAIKKTYV